ncbi:hypothetical protein [Nocardia neocaledoniensis]|uniref:hypothetical protein n=1 Tax=Nocardia neocaledoniensis TaxID=236511 RepID=UPI002454363F|nr:hypothetical protein [Nocardia neocaledoniensis]
MAYEVVYSLIFRAVDEGCDDPARPYDGMRFIKEDGEALAHAAAAPEHVPVCGATDRVVVTGFPWTDPVFAMYRRCEECVALCPPG